MKTIKEQAEAAAKEWRLSNEELLYPNYSPNEIEVMEQAYGKGFECNKAQIDQLRKILAFEHSENDRLTGLLNLAREEASAFRKALAALKDGETGYNDDLN